ncbi:MAG TPA: RNA polymerase sigma-70 factor [Niastella sp.]|nr:RNA polymerase sigma-70 factor [Niastella sp.]
MSQNSEHIIYSLPNEKALLARIAAGDETAFRAIYDHYRKKIYTYTIRLTESEAIADDIIQDVFMKVWMNRQSLECIGNFNAWLHTVARNHIADVMKILARARLSHQQWGQKAAAGLNNVEENLADKENQQLLQQALNQLSPQQRLIYHLTRHEGTKHAEIAGKLQISRHTVKTHLVHALRSIRNYLQLNSDQVLFIAITFSCFKN